MNGGGAEKEGDTEAGSRLRSVSTEPDTEIEHGRGGAEREGDTESEAGSGPRAVSTESDAGLELTDPGAPSFPNFLIKVVI